MWKQCQNEWGDVTGYQKQWEESAEHGIVTWGKLSPRHSWLKGGGIEGGAGGKNRYHVK